MTPSRSTNVTLVNWLDQDVTLTNNNLDHGIWSQSLSPPQTIKAGSTATFQNESDGFMTGDQGWVTYTSTSIGDFTFRWDNPYTGNNSASADVPSGYEAEQSGGSGNNAEIQWVLQKLNQ